jgi:hypothetical protein
MSKKPIKKITVPSGTLFTSASGRQVLIPFNVQVITPRPDFHLFVRHRVQDGVRGLRQGHMIPFNLPGQGSDYWRMLYFITKNHIYITVQLDGDDVGWAMFNRKDGNLQESFAAIDPKHHGKGVYSAVLREMRRLAKKRPLLSDRALSIANILVWSKVGTFSKRRGRFRHNPGPSRLQYEKALIALYNRAYTV